MKKLGLFLFILFVAAVTIALAQQAPVLTIRGDIIDNMCAGTQTPSELAAFVPGHTKECALAPPCVASGYSLFDGTQLYKFDSASNAKVESFLRKAASKLQVVIEARKGKGNVLSLVSIMNQ
jgi:hypothetical protein